MMKKRFFLLVIFLVLSVAVIIGAQAVIYPTQDAVTFTENVTYGERSAASGLEVSVSAKYRNTLYWDCVSTIGDTVETKTDFQFNRDRRYPYEVEDNRQLILRDGLYGEGMVNHLYNLSRWYDAMYPGNPTVQPRYMEIPFLELYDKLKEGETAFERVRLGDYFDYYPIEGSLRTANFRYKFDPYNPNKDTEAIQNFFKIPVLENDYRLISCDRDPDGLGSIGVRQEDLILEDGPEYFTMNIVSDFTDNAFYFTFDTHLLRGGIVDTSQIPGGYGIYSIPYDQESAKFEELSMVYALDPSVYVLNITCLENTRLYLYTYDGSQFKLTVIDIVTMESVQEITLMNIETDRSPGVEFHAMGEYMLCAVNASHYIVLSESTSAPVEILLKIQYTREEGTNWHYGTAEYAFDGERLAVGRLLKQGEWFLTGTSSFYIAVYGQTGLLYKGEYTSSLDEGYSDDLAQNVQPNSNLDYFQIEWKH